jgi:pSer/pThr/pTyr-binding forkhead associated (FHA) protein
LAAALDDQEAGLTVSKLVLFLPDGTTLDVPLDRERMTIGRRADNEICLPNLAVSGEHAVVVTILADSFLEDLGSTNGTLVNGKAIAKHFLRDRDEIDVGRHKLVYCADDSTVLAREPLKGMARMLERNFGGTVDLAKPVVRSQRQVATLSAIGEPAAPPAPASAPPVAGPQGPDIADATMPPERRAPPAPPSVASIQIMDGINAGVSVPLTKPETTIGRPGVQVAVILKTGDSFVLRPLEGGRAPIVNGQAIESSGRELAPGDLIELAGTKIQFIGTGNSGAKLGAPEASLGAVAGA